MQIQNALLTGSTTVYGPITFVSGSLTGTASLATNASTASFVLPLSQSVIITGSLLLTGSLRSTAELRAPSISYSSEIATNGGEIRIAQTQFKFGNNIKLDWSETTDSNGTRDLGIRRNNTGSLEIYDGNTAGNRRDLTLRNITGSNAFFSSSLIVSGSSSVTGSLNVSGSITTTGAITAQTLVVQTITSSILYSSGSNIFGNQLTNTQTFTGSVNITGSSHSILGSLNLGTTSSITNVALNIQSLSNSAGIVINNSNPSAYTGLRIYNDQVSANRALEIDYAGSTYGGALVSSGIAGESAAIVATGAYPLQFGTSNTFRMCILSGGNVGIGTTTPSSILDVRTGAGTSGTILSLQNTTAANASNIVPIRFYSGNTFGGLEQIAAIWGINPNAGANNGGTLVFATSANGTATTPAEKMRITSAGNVGIGTTPDTKLHLYDGTNPLSLKIQRTTVPVFFSDVQTAGTTAGAVWSHNIENTSNGSFTWSGLTNTSYAGSAIMLNSDTSNSYITFHTSGSVNAAPTERMRITGAGNVGIGLTSAPSKLSVDGGLQVNGTYTNLGTGTATYTQTTWYVDTTNQILFENGRTTDSSSGTGRTVYFTWRGGPGVGGGVQLQHGANAWAAYTSDARMKTKVADVVNGLDTIMKLSPIKFKWTRELENSRTVTGFTAQNVGEAIPDAVFNSWQDEELGDVKSYYQDYLVPYLVKAIQELSTKLEEATTRINALESR